MVGVPIFFVRCDCGPSSRIGWPRPCFSRSKSMIGEPATNTKTSAVIVAPPVRNVM